MARLVLHCTYHTCLWAELPFFSPSSSFIIILRQISLFLLWLKNKQKGTSPQSHSLIEKGLREYTRPESHPPSRPPARKVPKSLT